MKSRDKKSANAERIELEDALKHLLDCDEAGSGATVDSLAGALGRSRRKAAETLGRLRAQQMASAEGDRHQLTKNGRLYALQVVRTHRLYETWLARHTGTPAEEWHQKAHKAEHMLDAKQADALANQLNNPRFDPHGDPIPTREGHLPKRRLVALASWEDGKPARVEHIEDEPESLYAAIQKLGLAPGTILHEIRHLEDGAIAALVEGRRMRIPAAAALLIHVHQPAPEQDTPLGIRRLADLNVGDEAVVHSLTAACTGPDRHRLLDLGVVPGTHIRCEFDSALGSPRSYRIRGASIALRTHQAERILIEPDKEPTA